MPHYFAAFYKAMYGTAAVLWRSITTSARGAKIGSI
jgi:hypothetical protein